MDHNGFRKWMGLGGLAVAALLGVGCSVLPVSGGKQPDEPRTDIFRGEVRGASEDYYSKYQFGRYRGYNGTIADIGSSIDPRTPEREGTPGRSRFVDVTGRTPPGDGLDQGIGGSGEAGQAGSTSDMGWRARRGGGVSGAGATGSVGGQNP